MATVSQGEAAERQTVERQTTARQTDERQAPAHTGLPPVPIDLRIFPGAITVARLITAADQALTQSARRNAAAALKVQASSRRDFDAQESDWLTGANG